MVNEPAGAEAIETGGELQMALGTLAEILERISSLTTRAADINNRTFDKPRQDTADDNNPHVVRSGEIGAVRDRLDKAHELLSDLGNEMTNLERL